MARPSGPKVRCNNQWTEARYINFIKNLLRSGTRKWGPKQTIMSKARVRRGYYECASCHNEVPFTIKEGRKRKSNVFVDHIKPIIDPLVGFTTWDSFIENLFCEEDGLQVLCKECHDIKTKQETDLATERRRNEKDG